MKGAHMLKKNTFLMGLTIATLSLNVLACDNPTTQDQKTDSQSTEQNALKVTLLQTPAMKSTYTISADQIIFSLHLLKKETDAPLTCQKESDFSGDTSDIGFVFSAQDQKEEATDETMRTRLMASVPHDNSQSIINFFVGNGTIFTTKCTILATQIPVQKTPDIEKATHNFDAQKSKLQVTIPFKKNN